MDIDEYQQLVLSTDQSKPASPEDRKKIMVYGLIGEIGSVVSELKKHLLKEDPSQVVIDNNSRLAEELGDCIWYVTSLCIIHQLSLKTDVMFQNLERIKAYPSERNHAPIPLFDAILKEDDQNVESELAALGSTDNLTFDEYQRIASLTARESGTALAETCLAFLLRHAAQIQRSRLPENEIKMMGGAQIRDTSDVLGDIVWHLSAIASIYNLTLGEIVAVNARKTQFRHDKRPETRTTPHDESWPNPNQKFPRKFKVVFISRTNGRARMYYNNAQIGDDLTDNALEEDGYRFHDVMHLANVAHLGWSPVLRKLMGIKRKDDKKIDEAEDGARAAIVEEAIVKIIHSEGCRLALSRGAEIAGPNRSALFTDEDEISFSFLKLLKDQVKGLEVEKNKFWEWESAIREGYQVFDELERAGQGTVIVDMVDRHLSYDADVEIDIPGLVVGHGVDIVELDAIPSVGTEAFSSFLDENLTVVERAEVNASKEAHRMLAGKIAAKHATLKAISKDLTPPEKLDQVEIRRSSSGKPRAVLLGDAMHLARQHGIVTLQISISHSESWTMASAVAMADSQ